MTTVNLGTATRGVIDEEFYSLCLPSPLSQESSRRQAVMSTFRQEDVEDHYEMGEELGR